MPRIRVAPMAVAIILVSAGSAVADKAAAETCRAALDPAAQAVYDSTIAQNPTPATAREIVTRAVEAQISAGKLSISEGRAAGRAAGACLEKLE